MPKYNVDRNDIDTEMRLVEMALEDEEKRFMMVSSKTDRERSERKILDYEQHLKNLANSMEYFETGLG